MQLSQDEEAVFFDVDFIRTKRVVSEKIFDCLSVFQKEVSSIIQELHPDHQISNFKEIYPKISRGENYGGLPYFMLDYPRFFNTKNTFAIRTMVYWGNFYSFTLQVSGENQLFFAERFLENIEKFSSYYCCTGDTPWEYHYNNDNYQEINTLPKVKLEKMLLKKQFFKLSIPYPLSEYQNLQRNGLLFYQKIISLLN